MTWNVDDQSASAVIDVLSEATAHNRNNEHRDRSVVRLPRRGRLLATGDLHDNTFHLDAIIRASRLDQSVDHHVIFHELIHGEHLINGMDFSYRMLVKVAELKCRYPNQVHPLLANHELAQMTQRPVTKGAGDNVALFNDAVEYVFGDDADDVTRVINEFLRSWPIALLTESGLMCSHSLPPETSMKNFDPTVFERDLTDADYESRTGSAYLMTWGRVHGQEHLDLLCKMFKVRTFIVGHALAETGYEPVGRQALVLNSDHERGVVLPVNLADEPDRETLMWSIFPIVNIA